MTIATFLLAFGLALRLTRLVTTDSISQPARLAIARRQADEGWRGWLSRWATIGLACDWCVGVWASAGAFAYAHQHHSSFVWVAAAASASFLVGIAQMLTSWLAGDDE